MNKPVHPQKNKPRRRDPEEPPEDGNREITEREVEDVEERSRPRTPVIYEVVRRIGWWAMASGFFVPVLIGNVIGGTVLFALISYAQVMEEI